MQSGVSTEPSRADHPHLSHGLKICMYADDHAPPHFHWKRPGMECQIRLSDLTIMAGQAHRRDLDRAAGWAANIDLLKRMWSDLNERD